MTTQTIASAFRAFDQQCPTIEEFSIVTADGEYDQAYDEYVLEHVAIWTSREDAEYRRDQIRSAGYRFNDPNLTTAEVVTRRVTEWSSL